MISTNRNALICDLAETYGIYDYRSLPLETVATLSAGLRSDSRIKMEMRGENAPKDTMLLAHIVDGVNGLLWYFGLYSDKPASLVESLLGLNEKDVEGFKTPEEFEAARNRIIMR